MKKKVLGILGLAALTITSMLAPVNSVYAKESEDHLKVGLSFATLNFPYFVRMYDSFIEEAEKNNWEVSFVDGNLDAATQLNGIQDLINDDVDVMVVSTWFMDAMEDVLSQCKEKDIPVFVIGNTDYPDNINELITYACGTEHYDAGHIGGTYMSKYIKDQGKDSVKMATMVGSTEQMKARAQGFVDAMEEHGISVEVLNEYDVTTREEAMASGEDALTTYPDIELIYGVSAQGALGAYDATVGANRTEVMVFGYDGEDEELEVIDGDNNYVGTVTQAPDVEAVTTVEYINKYLEGEEFDKVVPISAGVYCDEGQLSAEEVEEAAK